VTDRDEHEPVTITDKRRVDPITGEVRDSGPAPSGSAPEPAGDSDEAAELKEMLQRVKAEYDNYRKRAVRQEQAAADRAKAAVAVQLLPVLDDLDRARRHGDLEAGPLKSVGDKLPPPSKASVSWRSAPRVTPSTRRSTRLCNTKATAPIPCSAT
jgi:molecular chaperone GrpE